MICIIVAIILTYYISTNQQQIIYGSNYQNYTNISYNLEHFGTGQAPLGAVEVSEYMLLILTVIICAFIFIIEVGPIYSLLKDYFSK